MKKKSNIARVLVHY